MSATIDIPTDVLEQIAARAAELVIEQQQSTSAPDLVDAATVAQKLGVSRDTVYARADELGGRRIGQGKRPRLRFDLADALAAWQPASQPTVTRTTPRRRKSSNSRRDLLPVIDA